MATIRAAAEDDWPHMVRLAETAFGNPMTDYAIVRYRSVLEHAYVATEGHEIVGCTADLTVAMTVPGGAQVRAPGLDWVCVSPAQRRRGILRALLTEQQRHLDGPIAVLQASEAGIYGRFGYGPATFVRAVEIDRRKVQLRPGPPEPVDMLSTLAAEPLVQRIYERWQRLTPGAQVRPDSMWELAFIDDSNPPVRDGQLFAFVHPDGFAIVRRDRTADRDTAQVREFRAVTAAAHRALWHALLGLDHTDRVVARLPPDDPLPYLLVDHRVIRTTSIADGWWVQLLDIPAALESRTYAADLDVVLEVRGDGRFALTVCGGSATCRRTDEPATITVDRDVLGSLFFGARAAATFAGTGRIGGERDLLLALDRSFATQRPAQCGWDY